MNYSKEKSYERYERKKAHKQKDKYNYLYGKGREEIENNYKSKKQDK